MRPDKTRHLEVSVFMWPKPWRTKVSGGLVSAPECLPMEVSVSEGSILLQSIIFVR